jgi:hypothetical protein
MLATASPASLNTLEHGVEPIVQDRLANDPNRVARNADTVVKQVEDFPWQFAQLQGQRQVALTDAKGAECTELRRPSSVVESLLILLGQDPATAAAY